MRTSETTPTRDTMAVEDLPAGFYVYTHASTSGRVFYVGKGTGSRAWTPGRDALWELFVASRLLGKYTVEIVASGLSEDDALDLEAQLLARYGSQLLNRINIARGLDVAALDRRNALHRECDALESLARETEDPAERAARFRDALSLHAQAGAIVFESGLAGELLAEMPIGKISLIEGLVRALLAAHDPPAAGAALDSYLQRYPSHESHGKTGVLRRAIERRLKTSVPR